MLVSRRNKVLTALFLASALAACTTTKAPDTSAADQAATDKAAADKAAADKAAADKAAADQAAAAAAAANAAALQSQSLADKSKADAANQLAAALGVKTVHFAFDSSTIDSGDYNTLKAHALYLSKNSSAHVVVAGNTDERGTREYNMALGERRAKAVAAFLTSNGARGSQLEVVSYGEEKPVAAGHTEDDWAQNRRVDLNYSSGNP